KYRLLAIHEKFYSLKDKIAAKLALSPEQEAVLEEKLKQVTPIKKDHINVLGDSVEEVNRNADVDELLYQGDIVLTDAQAEDIAAEEEQGSARLKRQAINGRMFADNFWRQGIFYSFHKNATAKVKSVFKKAANLWHKDTCIDFSERPSSPERLEVMVESGCWSFVGNHHKALPLSLGLGCDTVEAAAHELGHSIGMFHTHSRHDRDDYIMIKTHNIKSSSMDQFTKQTPETNDNYGIEYDYGSIMHYTASGSSYNGQPVMVPKEPYYLSTLGSPLISFNDLLMVNTHYGCLKKCNSSRSAAKCMMGGFPHPRDCSRCVCPSGFGGKLCNERPSGCGAILQATSTPKTLEDTIGDFRTSNYRADAREDFTMCNYWILAPAGKQIEVKVKSISDGFAVEGCKYGGVEIKADYDQTLTGFRFCAREDAGKKLLAPTNLVPIITYNRFHGMKTVLEYRAV
ncbi:astacin, partial [Oesophagostomum dentatum]